MAENVFQTLAPRVEASHNIVDFRVMPAFHRIAVHRFKPDMYDASSIHRQLLRGLGQSLTDITGSAGNSRFGHALPVHHNRKVAVSRAIGPVWYLVRQP